MDMSPASFMQRLQAKGVLNVKLLVKAMGADDITDIHGITGITI